MAIASYMKWAALLVVVVGLTLSPGCSRSRKTYQVSGRVQYKDGSPITGGVRVVHFEPTQSSTAEVRKAAVGEIGTDGSFAMYTRKPGDGVIAGKYAVTFAVMDKPMGGKMLILPKYVSPTETPFEITVDGDKSDLLYELEKQ